MSGSGSLKGSGGGSSLMKDYKDERYFLWIMCPDQLVTASDEREARACGSSTGLKLVLCRRSSRCGQSRSKAALWWRCQVVCKSSRCTPEHANLRPRAGQRCEIDEQTSGGGFHDTVRRDVQVWRETTALEYKQSQSHNTRGEQRVTPAWVCVWETEHSKQTHTHTHQTHVCATRCF